MTSSSLLGGGTASSLGAGFSSAMGGLGSAMGGAVAAVQGEVAGNGHPKVSSTGTPPRHEVSSRCFREL